MFRPKKIFSDELLVAPSFPLPPDNGTTVTVWFFLFGFSRAGKSLRRPARGWRCSVSTRFNVDGLRARGEETNVGGRRGSFYFLSLSLYVWRVNGSTEWANWINPRTHARTALTTAGRKAHLNWFRRCARLFIRVRNPTADGRARTHTAHTHTHCTHTAGRAPVFFFFKFNLYATTNFK